MVHFVGVAGVAVLLGNFNSDRGGGGECWERWEAVLGFVTIGGRWRWWCRRVGVDLLECCEC